MPDEDGLDINKVIEQSAKRTTLSDLARKGIQRVKVLDERAIHDLIRQAVEKVTASRTHLLAEEERTRLFAESRKELDRLLRDHNEMKGRAELLEAGKNDLVQQIEKLQRQLQLQRQLEEENLHKRTRERTEGLETQLQELRERHESGQRELKTLRGDVNRQLTELTGVQQELERARGEAVRLQRVLEGEQERLREARAQLAGAGQIDAKLASLQQSLERKLQASQESSLSAKLEALGSKDTEMASKLERLFARMTDNLGRKIGAIRTGGEEETEYRPGEFMMESLFKQELESNLQSIDTQTKTEETGGSGGRMHDALAKLRALRGGPGGGDAAPPPADKRT